MANPARIASIADLADAMRRDHLPRPGTTVLGRTVLLVGAGCSRSAGIPLASEIAQELVVRLADSYDIKLDSSASPDTALASLVGASKFPNGLLPDAVDRIADWPAVYEHIFSDHYKTPKEIRGIFSQLFDRIDRRINWAHMCIGELVRLGYVSTIITTNFDQLVLDGLARSGRLPVVADGLDSLYRINGDSNYPQLIQIHGSRHTYYLRNSQTDTDALATNQAARHAIDELFRTAGALVAVGYGGRERGLMQLLIDAGQRWPDTQIFWVLHEEHFDTSKNIAIAELLETSRYATIIPGQDADDFFRRLLNELGVDAPRAISDPLFPVRDLKENLVYGENIEIKKIIDNHQNRVNEIQSKFSDERIDHSFNTHFSTAANLAQSQRLQAVGQLSAGIAHDFGNVLDSISASTTELMKALSPSDPAYEQIIGIRQSASKGSSLIRQLLAFSRKQEINPEIIDLNDLVGDILILLSRLVGDKIKIGFTPNPSLWTVKMDIGQVEQVLVNLIVNARDAMPDGGDIYINLKNRKFDRGHLAQGEPISEGDYVEISVKDSGIGIPSHTINKIFEPFFTTKDPGKGSGLGLSMVYGIVKQSGGYISIASAPSDGSEFTIIIPRHGSSSS